MAEHGRKRHGVYGVRRVYWEGARVGVKRLRRAEAWAATARITRPDHHQRQAKRDGKETRP